MEKDKNSKNEPFYGMIVLVAGVILFFICLLYFGDDQTSNQTSNRKPEAHYVFYDVPTYTTIYEIVYPDTVYRYTVVHHSPSKLSSSRGTNYLYSTTHDGSWADECPDYWLDAWNKDELNVSTTAPIRIVSETVKYKKTRYKKNK